MKIREHLNEPHSFPAFAQQLSSALTASSSIVRSAAATNHTVTIQHSTLLG